MNVSQFWYLCSLCVVIIQAITDRYEPKDLVFFARIIVLALFGPFVLPIQLLGCFMAACDRRTNKDTEEFLKRHREKNIPIPKDFWTFTRED